MKFLIMITAIGFLIWVLAEVCLRIYGKVSLAREDRRLLAKDRLELDRATDELKRLISQTRQKELS